MLFNIPTIGVALPGPYAINDGGDNLSEGQGGPFILDGVKVPVVALCGGRQGASDHRAEHVCVHEFGQLLGLADMCRSPSGATCTPPTRTKACR